MIREESSPSGKTLYTQCVCLCTCVSAAVKGTRLWFLWRDVGVCVSFLSSSGDVPSSFISLERRGEEMGTGRFWLDKRICPLRTRTFFFKKKCVWEPSLFTHPPGQVLVCQCFHWHQHGSTGHHFWFGFFGDPNRPSRYHNGRKRAWHWLGRSFDERPVCEFFTKQKDLIKVLHVYFYVLKLYWLWNCCRWSKSCRHGWRQNSKTAGQARNGKILLVSQLLYNTALSGEKKKTWTRRLLKYHSHNSLLRNLKHTELQPDSRGNQQWLCQAKVDWAE